MKISDVIMAQFFATKLAADMDAKHGWGAEQIQAIREFAEDIGAAIQNDCRQNGPRGRRVKQKLATALDADLGRVERENAVVNRSGLGSVTLTQTAYRDALRVAMMLRALHPEDLPDGLGPDPDPGTPDAHCPDSFGTLYDYQTGDSIRPATRQERDSSDAEVAAGNHEGVIAVDWRSDGGWNGEDYRHCFVQ